MDILKITPDSKTIEAIIKDSTIELMTVPGEYVDQGDEKPSDCFVFWGYFEDVKTFPSDMSLIDLLEYMKKENKRIYTGQGEHNIKRKLKAIEELKRELYE